VGAFIAWNLGCGTGARRLDSDALATDWRLRRQPRAEVVVEPRPASPALSFFNSGDTATA
jgi:hypothetical protein